MTGRTLLLIGAALALAAGLGGPLVRFMRPPPLASTQPTAEARQGVADELIALRTEFLRDREQLLLRMRDLLAREDYAAAMALGAKYRRVIDPELYALYRHAVDGESFRQRVDEVRALMARQCQPLGARAAATQFLRTYAVLGEGASVEKLVLRRLPDADVHAKIIDLITQPRDAMLGEATDPVSKARAVHRVRLHPFDAIALQSKPLTTGIVCAWRLEGPIAASSEQIRLDFWLAPAPTAKSLDFEPLVYAETSFTPVTPSRRQARSSSPVANTTPTKPPGP